MFGFLKKGLGKIRDGLRFVARRREVWIVAEFISPPMLRSILPYVRRINSDRGKSGKERMLRTIKQLRKDPAFASMKESKLRWIIETALQVVEGELEQVD